jgi:hypothetical protein
MPYHRGGNASDKLVNAVPRYIPNIAVRVHEAISIAAPRIAVAQDQAHFVAAAESSHSDKHSSGGQSIYAATAVPTSSS